MPIYKVRDNETGQVYSIQGDAPPTPQELEQTFSATRQVSRPPTQPTQPEVPESGPGMIQSIARGAANIFSPRSLNFGEQIAGSNLLNRQLPGIQERQDQGFSRSRDLIQQAKNETDPVKKQRLLALSRDMDQSSGMEIDQLMGDVQQRLGKTYDQYSRQDSPDNFMEGMINPAYMRQGLGVGAEVGSYIAPQVKAFKGTSALGRVGNAALSGGFQGALRGVTDPYTQSLGETAQRGLTDAAIGAGTSAAFATGGELIKNLAGANKGRFDRAMEKSQAERPGVKFKESPTLGKKLVEQRYSVPAKVADDIKLDQTLDELARYNLDSIPIDDQLMASQLVTGPNGAMTGMTYEGLLGIQQPIGIDDAFNATQGVWDDATPQQVQNAGVEISNVLSNYKATPSPQGFNMQPLDAFDAAQALERKAYSHYNKSTYLTPNYQHEDLGDIFMKAARSITDNIDNAADDSVMAGAKSPELLAQLAEVSPQLADDAAKATSWKQFRALAAPFVRISKAIDQTKRAQHSVFGKYVTQQQQGLSLNPIKIANKVAGATVFSPDNTARMGSMLDTLANARSGVGQTMQGPAFQAGGDFIRRLGTGAAVSSTNQSEGEYASQ